MKGKRKAINKCLRETDFRFIKDSMVLLDLTWRDNEGNEYIPTLEDLETKAAQMLKTAADSGTSYCKLMGNNFIAKKSATSLELTFFLQHSWG